MPSCRKGKLFMSKPTSRTLLTRREALFLSATAGINIAASNTALASDSVKTAAHQEPGNCSTPRSAIAKTQYGKVRGFLDGGVPDIQGCSLWSYHGRRESLAARQAARTVDGRISSFSLRSELPSDPASVDQH